MEAQQAGCEDALRRRAAEAGCEDAFGHRRNAEASSLRVRAKGRGAATAADAAGKTEADVSPGTATCAVLRYGIRWVCCCGMCARQPQKSPATHKKAEAERERAERQSMIEARESAVDAHVASAMAERKQASNAARTDEDALPASLRRSLHGIFADFRV